MRKDDGRGMMDDGEGGKEKAWGIGQRRKRSEEAGRLGSREAGGTEIEKMRR